MAHMRLPNMWRPCLAPRRRQSALTARTIAATALSSHQDLAKLGRKRRSPAPPPRRDDRAMAVYVGIVLFFSVWLDASTSLEDKTRKALMGVLMLKSP